MYWPNIGSLGLQLKHELAFDKTFQLYPQDVEFHDRFKQIRENCIVIEEIQTFRKKLVT